MRRSSPRRPLRGVRPALTHPIVRRSLDEITDVLTLDGLERAIVGALDRHRQLGEALPVLDSHAQCAYDTLGHAIKSIHSILTSDCPIQSTE
jgi:hypothetical protein